MTDLTHYNILKDFSLREAAYLAAGVDPAAIPSHTVGETILSAMERPFLQLLQDNRIRSTLLDTELPVGTLVPIWLDMSHPDHPPFVPTPGEVSRVLAEYKRDPEKVRFDRRRIANWFTTEGEGFESAYPFELSSPTGAVRKGQPPLNERERTTYLNIIGALLEMVITHRPGRESQADVISELIANYPEKQGIATSTLEQKFAEAKRRLRMDEP